MSKVAKYLKNKYGSEDITLEALNSVSDYRRAELRESLSDPEGNDSGYRTSTSIKRAQVSSGGGGFRGTGDSVNQVPNVYSPLWLDSNLSLPRDHATINAWLRSFYALNPFVHNAINLHSTYPISKLNIKCKNKKIENFFNDMAEELDLINKCVQIAKEYWLLGEAFPFMELDENKLKWSSIKILNPDYMIVKRTLIEDQPLIMMKPDENLKRIVTSNKSSDIEQRKQLNPYIVNCVLKGQNIPLDNFQVSFLARQISPYESRGTGLPVCVFKQLALFDKIKECKFAQADSMINPVTVVKVGNDNYKPTPEALESWRQLFEAAQYNKDFKIFTNEAVDIQAVGRNGGILDTSGDFTQLIKEILIGLQVPSVLMDGGSDTTYANGGVALDVLRQRYMQFRNMLASWLKRKVFAPISKMNEFYEYEDSQEVLIVPEVDWNHMSLFDAGDYIQNLVQLTAGEGEAKRVAVQELHRSLGLDYNDQIRKIKKENISNAILKKEQAALEAMTLNELRALTEEDEIEEKEGASEEKKLPGEEGGLPGMGGGPDLGLPGPDSPPEPTPPPPV